MRANAPRSIDAYLKQRRYLARAFGTARFVFNWGLATKRTAYAERKESVGFAQLSRMLTALKAEKPWLAAVSREFQERKLATAIGRASLLFAAGALTAVAQQGRAPLDLASFPRTSLQIVHRDAHHGAHKHSFDVWVADTPERAEQGLMFVSDLPESKGMVFPFSPPRVETMWMKNTYIELDMLFIGADGRVTKIIERAHAMSLETLSSDSPVSAVLELKGGEVAKLGLRVGDTVTWQKPTP